MSSGQNAILWIRGGHDNGKNIVLSADMTLIGRDPSNHVVVDEIPVSRRHAGIRMDRNGYWLEDFGSRNGTFVNGEEVEGEGRELRNMDRIEFGGVSSLQLIFTESGATGTFQVAKELRA